MSISTTIHCWLNRLRRNNPDAQPAFIPLTAEEISEVKSNAIFYTHLSERADPGGTAPFQLYGMPVHMTGYAVEQRARQLTVPFLHLAETSMPCLECTRWEDLEKMRMHMSTRVCAETRTLRLTFEWDRWAGFKRALRITRWFPVQTRTVLVDGRVLYPYLKVGLPHNRHSVQFRVNSQ